MSYLSVSEYHIEYFKNKDRVLYDYMVRVGNLQVPLNENIFEAIVLNITGQMLSNKASRVISNNLMQLCKSITPEHIYVLTINQLKSCGLSQKKAEYIKSLAEQICLHKIDFTNLYLLNNEEQISFLTNIKGVGIWTAEMVSLFCFGNMNIFSATDVALKRGILKIHKDFKTLSKKRIQKLTKLYAPYASVASLYYYYGNDH